MRTVLAEWTRSTRNLRIDLRHCHFVRSSSCLRSSFDAIEEGNAILSSPIICWSEIDGRDSFVETLLVQTVEWSLCSEWWQCLDRIHSFDPSRLVSTVDGPLQCGCGSKWNIYRSRSIVRTIRSIVDRRLSRRVRHCSRSSAMSRENGSKPSKVTKRGERRCLISSSNNICSSIDV